MRRVPYYNALAIGDVEALSDVRPVRLSVCLSVYLLALAPWTKRCVLDMVTIHGVSKNVPPLNSL